MRWFWIVTMLGLFLGCGGKEDRPGQITGPGAGGRPGPVTTTGGRATGGSGSGGSGGTAGDAAAGAGAQGGDDVDVRAPVVEITSPEAVSDPDAGPVLIADTVEVLCSVTKSKATGSANVDPSTVKIAMLDPAGKVLKELGGASTANLNEYAASFVVSTLSNGVVSFRCKANDVGAPPRTGSTEISTFVDRGPKITVVSPTATPPLPLKSAVAFEFSVDPWVLADGDVGAAAGDLTLTVLGVRVENLAPALKRPGFYVATVDFTDPILFPETPSGDIPVVITAANNRRSPGPAVRTEAYTFKLDGQGPVIKILSPDSEAIVGPKTRLLKFTVSDSPSGVDINTVTVSLNGEEFRYEPAPSAWTEAKGTFTFAFEKTKIAGSIAQATINIHAEDLVGNRGDGESRTIYLDDYPPIVSFNPGNFRIYAPSGSPGIKNKCSNSFDPLGDAVHDLQVVPPAALLRLLVWDETNYAPGQTIIYYSGSDKATVFLYLQPDPTQPLLVNTDQDSACDSVLTKDKNGKDLVLLHMEPVEPAGNLPNFINDFDTAAPVIPTTLCELSTALSSNLCSGHSSDLTYVVKHTSYGKAEPVVYAVEPKPASLACAGATWEVPVQKSGWVCVAAVASDFAQNQGLSAPLRLCIDDDANPATSPCEGVPPPSCTDGCTPPAEFPTSLIEYRP